MGCHGWGGHPADPSPVSPGAQAGMSPCSYFMTRTPFLVAASTSTLSTPVPALPTTCSLSAAASTSAVTLVAERTMSPSQSLGGGGGRCGVWDRDRGRGWRSQGGPGWGTAAAGGWDPPCETRRALASDGRREPAPLAEAERVRCHPGQPSPPPTHPPTRGCSPAAPRSPGSPAAAPPCSARVSPAPGDRRPAGSPGSRGPGCR